MTQPNDEYNIRVRGTAVIIRDDKVLLIKYPDNYDYPGGSHDMGETVRETVAREVLEEAGAEVDVGDLLLVVDSPPFKPDHTFGPAHNLSLFFECQLKPGSEPKLPTIPDENQIGIEWIPLSQLREKRVFPPIADQLKQALSGPRPMFHEETGD